MADLVVKLWHGRVLPYVDHREEAPSKLQSRAVAEGKEMRIALTSEQARLPIAVLIKEFRPQIDAFAAKYEGSKA